MRDRLLSSCDLLSVKGNNGLGVDFKVDLEAYIGSFPAATPDFGDVLFADLLGETGVLRGLVRGTDVATEVEGLAGDCVDEPNSEPSIAHSQFVVIALRLSFRCSNVSRLPKKRSRQLGACSTVRSTEVQENMPPRR